MKDYRCMITACPLRAGSRGVRKIILTKQKNANPSSLPKAMALSRPVCIGRPSPLAWQGVFGFPKTPSAL